MRRKLHRLDRPALAGLLSSLLHRGYEVFGPQVRDHAIQWLPMDTIESLPAGWTAEMSPASFRLHRRNDAALFGYWVGADGLKHLLHPPRACVAKVESNGGLKVLEQPPQVARRALFGVRACDLAAVAVLDRVLLGDRFVDDIYQASRGLLFVVAVNCTESASTCFCASMRTGPQAKSGFDIALTEHVDGESSEFLAEAGSALGAEVLEEAGARPATADWAEGVLKACTQAAASQQRALDPASTKTLLEQSFDSPRWEATARRCFACGNCTSVCPTCFCVNFEDTSSLDQRTSERTRVWDSCFAQSFTYIHGGSIRLTPQSRYRHWISHKLARWQDQFGMPGCVGCGRCITWCPAGIDITEECAALAAQSSNLPSGVISHGQ
jgi:sulfhydrogenase subunit beta (sulfur reductase)